MIDLERNYIIKYIDEQIRDAREERKLVTDMNCYAAGYNDAVVEGMKSLRNWILGE